MTEPKRIGIAIVEQQGSYLVGIRGPDVPLPGYAEFPGGKCLDQESASDCAVRECREESGLIVTPIRLLERVAFTYPHGQVDLHFFLCQPTVLADIRDQHASFRWVPGHELGQLKFPEANASIVQQLVKSSLADGRNPCPT